MRLIPTLSAVLLALGMLAGSAAAREAGPAMRPPAAVSEPGPADAASRGDSSPRDLRRGCRWPERTLAIGPADEPLHVGLKTYPQTLQLRDHEVVLTFDDGPSLKTTPRVLAALDAACVHATFFLIGRHADHYPALARRELAEGHTIGHHSNTHPSFTLRGFDEASGKEDIDAGVMAVERAIYGQDAASPKHPHTPFFRFPGFADTPRLLQDLDERHYTVFGTDLWAADWTKMTPDYERQKVLGLLEAVPRHNGIVLFHDTIESTAEMLPDLLADLRRRGYTIVRLVYDAKAPRPPLEHAGQGWTAETETIIAHLRRPIIPDSHHAGETLPAAKASLSSAPREVSAPAGVERQDRAIDDFACEPDCAGDDPAEGARGAIGR